MKNRAKCKLCNSIIESYHEYDYVTCKCSEISVTGGNIKFECFANDWNNFIRVDDQGNEIIVIVKDNPSLNMPTQVQETPLSNQKPTKKDLLNILEEQIKYYENLPQNAMSAPVSNYDLLSTLLILSAILRSDCN
jgi:hypothetical protein